MIDYISIFFLLYAVAIVIFVVFSFAGIYHLVRYSHKGDLSKFIIVIYSAISITVISVSIILLSVQLAGR